MLSLLFAIALSVSSHAEEPKLCKNLREAFSNSFDFSSLRERSGREMDNAVLSGPWNKLGQQNKQLATLSAAESQDRKALAAAVTAEDYSKAAEIKKRIDESSVTMKSLSNELALGRAEFAVLAKSSGLHVANGDYDGNVEFTEEIPENDQVVLNYNGFSERFAGKTTMLKVAKTIFGEHKEYIMLQPETGPAESLSVEDLEKTMLVNQGLEDCAFPPANAK